MRQGGLQNEDLGSWDQGQVWGHYKGYGGQGCSPESKLTREWLGPRKTLVKALPESA